MEKDRPASRAATANLKLRLNESLRVKIERAAKRRGVSMNREMNDRLAASFAKELSLEEMFGSKENYALARAMASAMHQTGRAAAFVKSRSAQFAKSWWTDPFSYNQAAVSASRILEAFRPPGDPSPPTLTEREGERLPFSFSDFVRYIGRAPAEGLIAALVRGGRGGAGDWDSLARELHEDLGTLGKQVLKETD